MAISMLPYFGTTKQKQVLRNAGQRKRHLLYFLCAILFQVHDRTKLRNTFKRVKRYGTIRLKYGYENNET